MREVSGGGDEIYVRDVSDFYSIYEPAYQAVDKNLFNVTGTEFYLIDELQEDVEVDEYDGKRDAIALLYTEDGIDQYVTYPSTNRNGYNTIITNQSFNGTTETIKMLLPSGSA